MPDCDYCGASFDSEDAYLDHLAADHEETELGSIDRRRVADRDADDGGFPLGPAVLVGLLAVSGVLVVYVTFFMGTGGGSGAGADDPVQEPTGVGTTHVHGSMTVVIDGEELDFSQRRYQLQDDAFHFEGGDGSRYHVHAQGVTLEYALETLEVDTDRDRLTVYGTVYDATDGQTVRYEVNGETVDPTTYVLQEGDEVTVVAG